MMPSRHPSLADLRRNHQSLAATVEGIRADIRAYPRVRHKIPLLYGQLAEHLRWQDARFFDALRRISENDRETLKIIEFLFYELKEVKIAAVDFMEKYGEAAGNAVSRQFPKEFADFAAAIEGRLQMEAEYLFPLLEGMEAA